MRSVLVKGHEFALPHNDPPEPIVYEAPPVDVDACEHCAGQGVVVVGYDEAERPLDEPCTWCDGSGDRRGWAGAA